MLWPDHLLESPPEVVLAAGYDLRFFRPGDEAAYLALMHAAGFDHFGEDELKHELEHVLPDGFFFGLNIMAGPAWSAKVKLTTSVTSPYLSLS